MFTLGCGPAVYLAAGVTDLRKGFDGLHGLVQARWGRDPLGGGVFVFCNRRRDTLKLLVWEDDGRWVCAKRLERGTFAWPAAGASEAAMTAAQLQLVLSGLDLAGAGQRARWSGEKAKIAKCQIFSLAITC